MLCFTSAFRGMLEDTPTGRLILATVLKVGAISDAPSWTLDEMAVCMSKSQKWVKEVVGV